MTVTNLQTGNGRQFNLTESADEFFGAILELSPTGLNLHFQIPTDEVELFESRFDGQHVSSFTHELRTRVDGDSSFTYREAGVPEGYEFTTYRRPD